MHKGWLKQLYYGVVKGETFLAHPLLLLIRIYWGALLVMSGIGKLGNINGVADYFATLNISPPLFMAYLVAAIEILGGISLFIGFATRLFSLLLVILFVTAYATAHQEALVNFFGNPKLFITQDPFLFLYASLVVLCFGPGLFSIDYWLEKRSFGKPL